VGLWLGEGGLYESVIVAASLGGVMAGYDWVLRLIDGGWGAGLGYGWVSASFKAQ
jgi:hypothetical protein